MGPIAIDPAFGSHCHRFSELAHSPSGLIAIDPTMAAAVGRDIMFWPYAPSPPAWFGSTPRPTNSKNCCFSHFMAPSTSHSQRERRHGGGARNTNRLADQQLAGRPAVGRPTAGRPAAGRSTAGRPSAGRPPLGRPSVGRPAAGRPAAGRDLAVAESAVADPHGTAKEPQWSPRDPKKLPTDPQVNPRRPQRNTLKTSKDSGPATSEGLGAP